MKLSLKNDNVHYNYIIEHSVPKHATRSRRDSVHRKLCNISSVRREHRELDRRNRPAPVAIIRHTKYKFGPKIIERDRAVWASGVPTHPT